MSLKKEHIQKDKAQMETDITQCLKVLSAGGLILYPTDTVWGIGCDATNAEAVKKVYQLKQRDDSKALIVLIDSADHLDHYVVDVPAIARELIDVAVKPLTIIYEGAYNLASNVLGDEDSVGIRIPNDEFCHRPRPSGLPTLMKRLLRAWTMPWSTAVMTPCPTNRRTSSC